MKTYLLLFLFTLTSVTCFADVATSPSNFVNGTSISRNETAQLAPSVGLDKENASPTFVIKLLKLIWLIIMLIVATILPPLAVLLYFGAHKKFFVCLLLTLLGIVPGIIYAWVQIIKGRKARKQGAI